VNIGLLHERSDHDALILREMMGALLKETTQDVGEVSCAAKNGNGFSGRGESSPISPVSRGSGPEIEPIPAFLPVSL
jgi:hypothetical protein